MFYDIGYTRHDRLTFRTEEPDYDLYILTGDSPNAVCTEFRKLIGHSYIPPKWAFGFAQSRWGYKTAEDVRAIARQYRENELHRGAGEGIFLHQSRRHPLCGCRVARQGLFCRFSTPGSAGLVRPPLQGTDRLRY